MDGAKYSKDQHMSRMPVVLVNERLLWPGEGRHFKIFKYLIKKEANDDTF